MLKTLSRVFGVLPNHTWLRGFLKSSSLSTLADELIGHLSPNDIYILRIRHQREDWLNV